MRKYNSKDISCAGQLKLRAAQGAPSDFKISRFQDFSIVLESLPFGAMCVLLEEYRVCHGEVRLYVVGGTLIHVKLSVAGSWMLGKRRQENIREKHLQNAMC